MGLRPRFGDARVEVHHDRLGADLAPLVTPARGLEKFVESVGAAQGETPAVAGRIHLERAGVVKHGGGKQRHIVEGDPGQPAQRLCVDVRAVAVLDDRGRHDAAAFRDDRSGGRHIGQ